MKFKKRIFSIVLMGILGVLPISTIVFAQQVTTVPKSTTKSLPKTWITTGQTPMDQLNNVYKNENKGKYDIQDSQFDGVTSKCSQYGGTYNIACTFYNVANKLHEYFQYVVFFGLAAATIILILNGMQFVVKGESFWKTFKSNIMYLIIGIFLLLGFYILIDVLTRFGNTLFEF